VAARHAGAVGLKATAGVEAIAAAGGLEEAAHQVAVFERVRLGCCARNGLLQSRPVWAVELHAKACARSAVLPHGHVAEVHPTKYGQWGAAACLLHFLGAGLAAVCCAGAGLKGVTQEHPCPRTYQPWNQVCKQLAFEHWPGCPAGFAMMEGAVLHDLMGALDRQRGLSLRPHCGGGLQVGDVRRSRLP